MIRQDKYQLNEDYAVGNHPVPSGDPRFIKELKKVQKKARTNYVGLANKAVTDRMRIKGFRFGDPQELDQDARKFWEANNMALQAPNAIKKAAKLGDVYGLVSPPSEPGGEPVITIEDPRVCITEPDPTDPMSSVAGLKFYEDDITGTVVAILYLPDLIYTYDGPTLSNFLLRETRLAPSSLGRTGGGWLLRSVQENTLGEVPLFRGNWQPEYGVAGMAECEDGGYDIQDRVNDTILQRMVIGYSQAYRQRWATGIEPPPTKKGQKTSLPWDSGADRVWVAAGEEAAFGDFEQADIRQLLEAARDDIGDFAAVTQTPVTYLTNKMVNVSADTMVAAQISLISKVHIRMDAMGWFFEQLIKACFAYAGDAKAKAIEASTVWYDAEARSLAEISDMVSKLVAAGVPLQVALELGGLDEDLIKFAVEEAQKQADKATADALQLAAASKPPPGAAKPSGNTTSSR